MNYKNALKNYKYKRNIYKERELVGSYYVEGLAYFLKSKTLVGYDHNYIDKNSSYCAGEKIDVIVLSIPRCFINELEINGYNDNYYLNTIKHSNCYHFVIHGAGLYSDKKVKEQAEAIIRFLAYNQRAFKIPVNVFNGNTKKTKCFDFNPGNEEEFLEIIIEQMKVQRIELAWDFEIDIRDLFDLDEAFNEYLNSYYSKDYKVTQTGTGYTKTISLFCLYNKAMKEKLDKVLFRLEARYQQGLGLDYLDCYLDELIEKTSIAIGKKVRNSQFKSGLKSIDFSKLYKYISDLQGDNPYLSFMNMYEVLNNCNNKKEVKVSEKRCLDQVCDCNGSLDVSLDSDIDMNGVSLKNLDIIDYIKLIILRLLNGFSPEFKDILRCPYKLLIPRARGPD